jgi:RNA polymerase sigma factor (TIGR02999 family)
MTDDSQEVVETKRRNSGAPEQLLPQVYDELRRLAAKLLAFERPGQTLQPTALVHEAYIRLLGGSVPVQWNGRGHFVSAATQAMRRVIIDNARRKKSLKRGGCGKRIEIDLNEFSADLLDDRLTEIDDALSELEKEFPEHAAVVSLRFYVGLTNQQTAEVLGISTATTQRYWTFARVWIYTHLEEKHADK